MREVAVLNIQPDAQQRLLRVTAEARRRGADARVPAAPGRRRRLLRGAPGEPPGARGRAGAPDAVLGAGDVQERGCEERAAPHPRALSASRAWSASACSLFCLPFYFSALAPAQSAKCKRSATQRGRARLPAQPVQPRDDGARTSSASTAASPRVERLPSELEALYAHAQRSKRAARAGRVPAGARRGSLAAYRVTLPVRGSYPQLRQFVGRVLKDMPTTSLDAVRFERSKAADAQLEAQVRLTIYSEKGHLDALRILLISLALLCGLRDARSTDVREAREHVAAGRSEQALVVLEKAMREKPDRHEYRAEYFRARDLRRWRSGLRRRRHCARAASPRPRPRSTAACRSTTPATCARRPGSSSSRPTRATA